MNATDDWEVSSQSNTLVAVGVTKQPEGAASKVPRTPCIYTLCEGQSSEDFVPLGYRHQGVLLDTSDAQRESRAAITAVSEALQSGDEDMEVAEERTKARDAKIITRIWKQADVKCG